MTFFRSISIFWKCPYVVRDDVEGGYRIYFLGIKPEQCDLLLKYCTLYHCTVLNFTIKLPVGSVVSPIILLQCSVQCAVQCAVVKFILLYSVQCTLTPCTALYSVVFYFTVKCTVCSLLLPWY